jgi:hypothetical protein
VAVHRYGYPHYHCILLDETEIVTNSRDPAAEGKTVRLTQTDVEAPGWFDGPPFAIEEIVFDEYDYQRALVTLRERAHHLTFPIPRQARGYGVPTSNH